MRKAEHLEDAPSWTAGKHLPGVAMSAGHVSRARDLLDLAFSVSCQQCAPGLGEAASRDLVERSLFVDISSVLQGGLGLRTGFGLSLHRRMFSILKSPAVCNAVCATHLSNASSKLTS